MAALSASVVKMLFLAIHIFLLKKYCAKDSQARAKIRSHRAPDKERISIYIMPISSPNPIFDHLLESSH